MKQINTPLQKSMTQQINFRLNPTVFVPAAFENKTWEFKAYEVRYLDALNRTFNHEKACEDVGLSLEQGAKILRRRKAKQYLADRLRERMAVEAFSQERFLNELIKVWNGDKTPSREQMEAIKELGARIAPKPERSTVNIEKPQITINMAFLEEIREREKRMKTEISHDQTS